MSNSLNNEKVAYKTSSIPTRTLNVNNFALHQSTLTNKFSGVTTVDRLKLLQNNKPAPMRPIATTQTPVQVQPPTPITSAPIVPVHPLTQAKSRSQFGSFKPNFRAPPNVTTTTTTLASKPAFLSIQQSAQKKSSSSNNNIALAPPVKTALPLVVPLSVPCTPPEELDNVPEPKTAPRPPSPDNTSEDCAFNINLSQMLEHMDGIRKRLRTPEASVLDINAQLQPAIALPADMQVDTPPASPVFNAVASSKPVHVQHSADNESEEYDSDLDSPDESDNTWDKNMRELSKFTKNLSAYARLSQKRQEEDAIRTLSRSLSSENVDSVQTKSPPQSANKVLTIDDDDSETRATLPYKDGDDESQPLFIESDDEGDLETTRSFKKARKDTHE